MLDVLEVKKANYYKCYEMRQFRQGPKKARVIWKMKNWQNISKNMMKSSITLWDIE